jgi:hypothetical protein
MTWIFSDKNVVAPNGRMIPFDFSVREFLKVGDIAIVILEVPPGRTMTENVFGISPDGTVLWQIERTAANSTHPVNRYLGVATTAARVIRIGNWNGISTEVDVLTGKILDTRVAK